MFETPWLISAILAHNRSDERFVPNTYAASLSSMRQSDVRHLTPGSFYDNEQIMLHDFMFAVECRNDIKQETHQ